MVGNCTFSFAFVFRNKMIIMNNLQKPTNLLNWFNQAKWLSFIQVQLFVFHCLFQLSVRVQVYTYTPVQFYILFYLFFKCFKHSHQLLRLSCSFSQNSKEKLHLIVCLHLIILLHCKQKLCVDLLNCGALKVACDIYTAVSKRISL